MTDTFTHGMSGYANHGCRCLTCRTARRLDARRRRGSQPSPLSLEVEQLNQELDAQELNLEALREENAMLRCRLDELEPQYLASVPTEQDYARWNARSARP